MRCKPPGWSNSCQLLQSSIPRDEETIESTWRHIHPLKGYHTHIHTRIQTKKNTLLYWGGILISEAIFNKLGRHISFAYARRVGRMIPNTNRRILIRPNDYGDKADLLTCTNNSPYNFENFVVNYEIFIEKLHISFIKKHLISVNMQVTKIFYWELAHFPLLHNAWALGVKDWLRLCNVTENVLLNQCFLLNVEENHNWL